ncbi:Neprosin domain-containing protein [Dioscorea alata]|uniref:Neprosin domain-containing protein n=1 Tax=Dioscorea alata TaxID=55571 RepID=A0ACB7TXF5_DIOAL|nr:Neprosin domain-containing protein [Dioscorea alata]
MASGVVAIGLLFLLFCCGLGREAKGWSKLSFEDDEAIVKQLRFTNKPVIKTIQNQNGDVVDCIDFDKQLAFDPLLKNQSIRQQHSFHKDHNNENLTSNALYSLSDLNGERCPPGTVPIRRTQRNDLIRLKSFLKLGEQYSYLLRTIKATPVPGVHWALLQSNDGKYVGARAWLNINGLQGVKGDQFSETAITLINGIYGPSQNYNVIKVGWMVHPPLYGDFQTRLTVFWTTDGYQSVHCYNQQCPGFVQVSSKIVLGSVLSDQGDDKFLSFSIFKDKVTGDWCLTITTLNGVENIGYWPKSMFSSLGDYAGRIQWGGLVYSPTSEPSPPMGNGKFPSNGGARVIKINMINENGQTLEPQGDELLYADKPDCYSISKLSNNRDVGWFFSFGGPGGCIG